MFKEVFGTLPKRTG